MNPEGNWQPLTKSALGVDIGGSAIKAAPVNLITGSLIADRQVISLPQPSGPDNVLSAVSDIISRFDWTGPLGAGYPGVVKNGIACSAANISEEWLGVNIIERLREITGLPSCAINDADAAGLAEMRFGAGRSFHRGGGTVLVATLGTGIGTAIFHDGRLLPNTEFGHLYMANGREAEEQAAGASRVREELSWEEFGRRVSAFLVEMNKLISPELVILGGGVSENFDKFEPFLDVPVNVVAATMGNHAGLIGAAICAPQLPVR